MRVVVAMVIAVALVAGLVVAQRLTNRRRPGLEPQSSSRPRHEGLFAAMGVELGDRASRAERGL